MLGISGDIRENDHTVLQWIADEGQKYPMISGREGNGQKIMTDYGGNHFPNILLIGPDKKIRKKFIEMNHPDQLEAILEQYIGQTDILINPKILTSPQRVKYIGAAENSLRIFVNMHGHYHFNLYSPEGTTIQNFGEKKYYSTGIHTIRYKNSLTKGVYIFFSESEGKVSKEKILF